MLRGIRWKFPHDLIVIARGVHWENRLASTVSEDKMTPNEIQSLAMVAEVGDMGNGGLPCSNLNGGVALTLPVKSAAFEIKQWE